MSNKKTEKIEKTEFKDTRVANVQDFLKFISDKSEFENKIPVMKCVFKKGVAKEQFKYSTKGSAALDLPAYIYDEFGQPGDIAIKPGMVVSIDTGISAKIPNGYVGLICSRSGLSTQHGIKVINSPGLSDSDYTGVIRVVLQNSSKIGYVVKHGERVAQLCIVPVLQVAIEEVDELETTERGSGGFGSTGK